MRYHQLRNATCVLEFHGKRVLVDPMLGDPGTLPPYAFVRSKARRNPLTPLPANADALLERIDACLVSHVHYGSDCDHLDRAGGAFLGERGIPVSCRVGDEKALRKRGIDAYPVRVGEESAFLGGSIEPVKASHGRGIVGRLMGPGVGYLLRIPGEPSVYLTGDTVLTRRVAEFVEGRSPDVIVVPGGGARLDVGGSVLMNMRELVRFVEMAPGRVVINHVGALNHCPIPREDLVTRFRDEINSGTVLIPGDGERVELGSG